MELQEVLSKRQSIRRYKDADVPKEDIIRLIRAAGSAPSGKNIQNWHFVMIKNKELIKKVCDTIVAKSEEIALQMGIKDLEKSNRFRKYIKSYTLFVSTAPVLIVVFTTFYNPVGYNELIFIDAPKEATDSLTLKSPPMQSLGASLENLTLSAVEMGYGTCWLTSANYAATEIQQLLKDETGFEKEGYVMGAMMTLGLPEENQKSPQKKPLEEIYTYIE